MKRRKILSMLLIAALCLPLFSSVTGVCAEDVSESEEEEIVVDEDISSGDAEENVPDSDENLTIKELIDKYLHTDVSVTPVLRDEYTGIEAQAVSSSAVTVSVSETVCELAEDGFVPYEIQWRVGSYFNEKSQYTNVTVDNLKLGTEYVVVAQIHYNNPETLVSHWLNLSLKVTTEGIPPVETVTPPAVTATPQPTVAPTPPAVNVTKPIVTSVRFIGNTISAKWQSDAGSYEYRILDRKGAIVKQGYSMGPYFYSYNIKKNAKLAVQVRGRIWDEASGMYSYSSWSKKRWVIKQPLATAKKIKKKSVKVRWNKITGAVKYKVYIRKHGVYKWSKVKTTKKRTCTIKKYKGKRLNTVKKKYDVKIVAIGKANGKKIVSDNSCYRKMHK